MGWSGGGYGAADVGRHAPGAAAVPTGWPAGEAQCTAPQAESDVIVLATTANGFSGSRRSSRGAGTNVARGITGVDGLSKTGRLLGAQAAAWVWGGAIVKGGASGV